MLEKKLKAAFTLVTGILLGSAGTALYSEAQKDRTVRDDFARAEAVERHILNLGSIDAYSRDNLPLQVRVSIAGLHPADAQDETNVRRAVTHTLKQQLAQKSAQELGVEQRLDEIRTSFTEQQEKSPLAFVTVELPQSKLEDMSRSLADTVRHTAAGNLSRDADVRLTLETTIDTRNVERYYARKDRAQDAQTAKASTGIKVL